MNLKNLKLVVVLISLTFFSCAQNSAKKEVKDSETTVVQTKQVVALISPNDLQSKLGDIQLIDVRRPEEYAAGHIEGSNNINFLGADFMGQMSKFDKNKEIYVYCRSGKRSSNAAAKLKEQGFTKIYDLQGGIINWEKNNFKIIN
jgi:phage shock protein E